MSSRKIVGYHLGKTLETKDTLKALEMALKGKPEFAFPNQDLTASVRGFRRWCTGFSRTSLGRLKAGHQPSAIPNLKKRHSG
jgi:ribonucleotide monophosphatase NagD (HAD superfamily)